MGEDPNIPDISEVDFDTRLKVLLGTPPEKDGEEIDCNTRSSVPIESDPDK